MSFLSLNIVDLLFTFDQNKKLLENILLLFVLWIELINLWVIAQNLIDNCEFILGIIKWINHLNINCIAFSFEFISKQVWVLIQFKLNKLLLQILIIHYWKIRYY